MTKPYINPSDARSWLHCKRRVWYDNFPPDPTKIAPSSEFDNLLITLGKEHEKKIKEILGKDKQLIEAMSYEHTQALIAGNVDIIYQPIIEDKVRWIKAKPDFLIRHKDGQYQAADAKLARSIEKDEIKIQLGVYRFLLDNSLPGIAYLSDETIAEIGDETKSAINEFITDMSSILTSDFPPEVRYGETKCNACPYLNICKPKFEDKEELTLLYGIDSRSAPHLEQHGITTITELSCVEPSSIPDIPFLKGFEKKQRAVLQAKAYFSNEAFQLGTFKLPEGTWIHFDIEDNPLTKMNKKHVYLWGFLTPPYEKQCFEYIWTTREEEDKQGWLDFLKLVEQYRNKFPDLVLGHFSAHEYNTINAYAKFYDMLNNQTVGWLLGENSPLYDIQKPIKEAFVLPLAGYGLKNICKHKNLVNFQWQNEDSEAQWSVVQFNKYLLERDATNREQIKKKILSYNFDDVMATRRLEEWLRTKLHKPAS
jgi:predicted RecB family nuclease